MLLGVFPTLAAHKTLGSLLPPPPPPAAAAAWGRDDLLVLLTWEEDAADHAWQDHHEEGQDLQVGGQQGSPFGVGEALGRQGPLNNDLWAGEHHWSDKRLQCKAHLKTAPLLPCGLKGLLVPLGFCEGRKYQGF